jgi:chaperone BCS1
VVRGSPQHNTNSTRETPDLDVGASNSTGSITLSGLLNVIDGVASQEGRILIMTTNHIEAIDHALLRPGRVDLRIYFDLARKKLAKDLFLQIFGDLDEGLEQSENTDEKNELEQQAQAFAAEIPEKVMSPAEIQGFLMMWKDKPADAVAHVKEWVEESTKKKSPTSRTVI